MELSRGESVLLQHLLWRSQVSRQVRGEEGTGLWEPPIRIYPF